MEFDHYSGLLRVPIDDALEPLASELQATPVRHPRPRHLAHVNELWALEAEGRIVGKIGKDDWNKGTHFELSGAATPLFVVALRKHFPIHSVARADVKEDFEQPGGIQAMRDLMVACKSRRMRINLESSFTHPDDPRTYYLGEPSSMVRVRLYESGKVMGHVCFGDPSRFRLELQVRPKGTRLKQRSASLPPEEFWGFARWSHRLFFRLRGLDVGQYRFDPVRAARIDLLRIVATQYRRPLQAALNAGTLERDLRDIWHDADVNRGRIPRQTKDQDA